MEVRVIKSNPFVTNKTNVQTDAYKLRVAAYARVSTDTDEQEDSFDRQVDYYTRYIKNNPNWEFVKVFSDPGITGTRADKRPGFQEMIEECRRGNIDKLLVKSLARFARNTVDALEYIRELKELGVGIVFEAQNIDTSTPGGDVLLTILAAMAEEESRTISKNVKWAMEKKFQKGEFLLNTTRFLGYTKDANKNIIVVEEEAKIVRRIFDEFLSGYAISQIQHHLNEEGIKSPCGSVWTYGVIESILHNEKYYGAALSGKTYKPDVLSKNRKKNEGQAEMYFVEGVIETPIISKEIFDMTQVELAKRTGFKGKSKNEIGRFCGRHTMSKMIRCGSCGAFYSRCAERIKGVDIPFWWCMNRRKGEKFCPQKGIREDFIERAFMESLNELVGSIDDVKEMLNLSIKKTLSNAPTEEIEKITEEVNDLQGQMFETYTQYKKGEIDEASYTKKASKLSEKITSLNEKKQKIDTSISANNLIKTRLVEITNILEGIKPDQSFDPMLFKKLIEVVVIRERYQVTFKFKIGIERTIDTSKYL